MTHHQLDASDPRERFRAVRALRGDYSQDAGQRLVEALCSEASDRVWWLLAITVLPIWLPCFDRYVCGLGSWPFSPDRTYRIIGLLGSNSLKCVETLTHSWLESDNLLLQVAAVKYRLRHSMKPATAMRELAELSSRVGLAYTGSEEGSDHATLYKVVGGVLALEGWAEEHCVTEDADERA